MTAPGGLMLAKAYVSLAATALIAAAQSAVTAGLLPASAAGWAAIGIAALGSIGVFAVPNRCVHADVPWPPQSTAVPLSGPPAPAQPLLPMGLVDPVVADHIRAANAEHVAKHEAPDPPGA